MQTDRQTDTQTHGQTGRQTDRQTDRHTDRQTDRQTHGHTDSRTYSTVALPATAEEIRRNVHGTGFCKLASTGFCKLPVPGFANSTGSTGFCKMSKVPGFANCRAAGYRDITCIMNARILNLPLYRTEGGGTEFSTPYADPYNELWLYNELTRILNGGGGDRMAIIHRYNEPNRDFRHSGVGRP